MTTPASETVGREYLRVSEDKSKRERSPEEQHADNQRAADRLGWTLGKAYRDVGSASRHGRKVREDFARLIADLTADRFGAHVLMMWESSRGSRKVGEWVHLIELCEERRVLIHVTSDGRTYDPTNPRDRRSLLEDAVDSEYEAAKTSKRVTRAAAANATAGRPNGPAPFGYRRTFDPRSGAMTGQEIEPSEAAVVREMYERLHGGHSLRSIATDLTSRGVRTRRDALFSPQSIRNLVMNRAYIAQRVHDPAGRAEHPSLKAATYEAIWPAIVDTALWLAVYRRLTAPERKTTRPGRGVHWLSMIARCDACSGPMSVRRVDESLFYACHNRRCTRVHYQDLNDYAQAVLLAYLGDADIAKALTAVPTDPTAIAVVRVDIEAVKAELDELADAVGRGELTAVLAARAEPQITARLGAAREREQELTRPSVLRGLITPGREVSKRWKVAPMPARREIARIVFAVGLLGELRVVRAPNSGRRMPVQDRVIWSRDRA